MITVSKDSENWVRMLFQHRTVLLIGAGCIITLILILIRPFYNINLWLSDRLFTSELPSPNIVIAGIDDATLEEYGKWSDWSRDLHTQAINNLNDARARVIGFDILFTDSSSNDEKLAETIENAGNVVLPLVGTDSLPSDDPRIIFSYIKKPFPNNI